ncbi:NUDIX hydrolase [Micrococcales bacterium 31B]|nr:NUDIX hydrolase [Micrococcales bacterium 31B]
MRDEFVTPTILGHSERFSGYVWDVVTETVDLGGAGGVVTRDFVKHPGAVSVVALNDREEVLLLRQYRHPVRGHLWEVPAGLLDKPGEPGQVVAARELAEEADLAADRWDLLTEWFTTPGGNDEALRVYLARDLRRVEHEFIREGEEAEMIARWFPLDTVVDAIMAGQVRNPSTIVGVLAAHTARGRNFENLLPAELEWPAHPANRASGK